MVRLAVRHASRTTVVVAATVAVATLAAGCRETTAGERIDVPAIERQLERIIGLELLAANFFDRDVEVSCIGMGSDGLHFRCHVDATNPVEHTQAWDELVACRPVEVRGEPRCYTETGDALL